MRASSTLQFLALITVAPSAAAVQNDKMLNYYVRLTIACNSITVVATAQWYVSIEMLHFHRVNARRKTKNRNAGILAHIIIFTAAVKDAALWSAAGSLCTIGSFLILSHRGDYSSSFPMPFLVVLCEYFNE